MASLARRSHLSLSSCPLCPGTHSHWTTWRFESSFSRSQRSRLRTSFLPEVFQPFESQDGIHSVMPRFKYCESVTTFTFERSLRQDKPSMAAVSSMRLFVVCEATPLISFT